MSFVCPECWGPECSTIPGSLQIRASIELPPDIRSDEITLQVVSCSHCRFQAVAVYEESRRGRLEEESFDHTGYRVRKEDVTALRRLIGQCPAPRKSSCSCAAHRVLGQRDGGGRWNGLRQFDWEGVFPMRIQR